MRLALLSSLVLITSSGCAGPPSAPAEPPPAEPPPIVQTGAPVLRARAAEVPPEQIGSPEMAALIARMIDTARSW